MTNDSKKTSKTLFYKLMSLLVILGLMLSMGSFASQSAFAQGEEPPTPASPADIGVTADPQPSISADGNTLLNGVPRLFIVDDPNPAMKGLQFPVEPELAAAMANPSASAATFSITYKAAGTSDPWGKLCYAFPAGAQTAFTAAANIWRATITSTVPITISACWASLTYPTLGYSGGAYSYRNQTGLPKANTWYESSLANKLHGSDLGPGIFDMNITYSKNFIWYYGTDGHPPAGQSDLVSVALHEIAHGLNFSGTASVSGSTGSLGDLGNPNIYDTFMEYGGATKLTSVSNPSTTLGTYLRSGNLWFNGPYAKAANGGVRPKMYAPGSWSGGSSYAHLDYTTFAGTANSLMVYQIAAGSSQHNPGAVTKGLLRDLGWTLASTTPVTVPTPISPSGATSDTTPTYTWSKITGATAYQYQLYKGTAFVYNKIVSASTFCGTTTCSNTYTTSFSLPLSTAYKWHVRAYKGAWLAYSAWKTFSIGAPVTVPAPTPISPSGATTDTTPTYTWSKITGATAYQYQLYKGTVFVYNMIVSASTFCGTTTCSNTLTTVLPYSTAYKWHVRAYKGAWGAYSAWKTFSINAPTTTKPKAGFWRNTVSTQWFYVTANQAYVDNYALRIYVGGCGTYIITHTPLVPIVGKNFSFSGTFYASGTFNTTSYATVTSGLTNYYIPGCGYVRGGPYLRYYNWIDSTQPTSVNAVDLPINYAEASESPYYETVTSVNK